MAFKLSCWLVMAAWLLAATPAAALSLGMSDRFQGGADAGWNYGAAAPAPPAVPADGGPLGAGDGYLALAALGGSGANSKLAVIAGPQWTGDYLAAGISGITMDLRNAGVTDLSLRLWLAGPAGASAVSATPVVVPAGSGWTPVHFALDAGTLIVSGPVPFTLGDVGQLRLFHATAPSFPGEAIVAALGVDNVTAVPEPAAPWLMLLGLSAVAAWQRRRAG